MSGPEQRHPADLSAIPPAHVPGLDDPRTPRPRADATHVWNMPFQGTGHRDNEEEFPRRTSGHIGPTDISPTPHEALDDSSQTPYGYHAHPQQIRDNMPNSSHPSSSTPRSSLSSTRRDSQQRPRSATRRQSVSFVTAPFVQELPKNDEVSDTTDEQIRAAHRRSTLSNMMDLYALDDHTNRRSNLQRDFSEDDHHFSLKRPSIRRVDSMASFDSIDFLEDDAYSNDVRTRYLEDPDDLERNNLRQMDYKARRKHLTKASIRFNVTSMLNRQEFLLALAKALMTFGAPSHRIETQLISAARILEVEAEFIHLPGVIISSFGDQELGCSETQFIKCGGKLSLGALHKLHLTYRAVVHDEISAKQATEQLNTLLTEPSPVRPLLKFILSFFLSALICPLAFGGSFLDMWIAGCGAISLQFFQTVVASKSALYANVFEITVAILVSFTARGLSSIKDGELFCYAAISSAGIIGILPGYLILSSSLELASKNIVCGSVKMVYALIYTLFLGFGLQIGSDLYLLFDARERHNLKSLASKMMSGVILTGQWFADNATNVGIMNNTVPLNGTWTFSHRVDLEDLEITTFGCLRHNPSPWYLTPFPVWTSFIIVPTFSLLSSLMNAQPLRSKQLPVMVVISCAAFAVNKIANNFIPKRSDIVSAIGAFTVGVLGNAYSRKMGGTAFTSMVTGVLFLVPSGLSQAGGIAGNGSGIDVGGAMISVTIGITVGLFMSQALVYMFGSRKGAASFSF